MKKDLRENDRIILAHGEVTGHCHEVLSASGAIMPFDMAQFFEEPDGRKVLIALEPCNLIHQEHGLIALDPNKQEQYRQGDVLLDPIGKGTWEVIRQREYSPERIRQVAD